MYTNAVDPASTQLIGEFSRLGSKADASTSVKSRSKLSDITSRHENTRTCWPKVLMKHVEYPHALPK